MWDLIGTTPALFLVSYEYIKATVNYWSFHFGFAFGNSMISHGGKNI